MCGEARLVLQTLASGFGILLGAIYADELGIVAKLVVGANMMENEGYFHIATYEPLFLRPQLGANGRAAYGRLAAIDGCDVVSFVCQR